MELMAPLAFLPMASFLFLGPIPVSSELSISFYDKSCPGMEDKISHVIREKMTEGQSITAPATLRLFFHDCFVQGCDGSVLISSTEGNKAERDADINLSLAGDSLDAVLRAKKILEEMCPGVVSCADILAVLARDSTMNGPSWSVLKGRRDSRTSIAFLAAAELPTSSANLTQLINQFASKGLTSLDLVALSGAHTAGSAHCIEVVERLRRRDPTMDPDFRASLLASCPLSLRDNEVVVTFDDTPFVFDNLFFKKLKERKALLTSDQTLLSGDDHIREAVFRYAENETLFFQEFAAAMQKIGSVGVLTGAQGEVRKDCIKIN
ncbi:peroxidase 31-like isoform X2 [Aristolochia californica]|uniref:peroxidase 31-like isoform X2 n=1 Tax=Aristolochia californica TaxID=171875 RepID=UPI0035D656CC